VHCTSIRSGLHKEVTNFQNCFTGKSVQCVEGAWQTGLPTYVTGPWAWCKHFFTHCSCYVDIILCLQIWRTWRMTRSSRVRLCLSLWCCRSVKGWTFIVAYPVVVRLRHSGASTIIASAAAAFGIALRDA